MSDTKKTASYLATYFVYSKEKFKTTYFFIIISSVSFSAAWTQMGPRASVVVYIHMYRVGLSIVDYFLRPRLLPQLGGRAERRIKSARRLSKWCCKRSGGEGWTLCHHGDGLPQNHHTEFCSDSKNMNIFEHCDSKNMVFNVNKLVNIGVDLMLRRRGKIEVTRAEWAVDFADLGRR